MGLSKGDVACLGCGWNGEIRIWGGYFGPYNDARAKHPDPMKRGRATPKSWRDGYCALCVWRRRNEELA